MTARVDVDPDVCIGSGSCAQIAPAVFELDEEGVARVIDPAGASLDDLQQAELSCPTGAITIDDDDAE